MYYGDHAPPHVHAEYRGESAKYTLTGEVIAGQIRSGTARRRIAEWLELHQGELEALWQPARGGKALGRVEPHR